METASVQCSISGGHIAGERRQQLLESRKKMGEENLKQELKRVEGEEGIPRKTGIREGEKWKMKRMKRTEFRIFILSCKTALNRLLEVVGLSVHGLANTMTTRKRVRLSTPQSSRQRGNPSSISLLT